jgi:hypothetical protein
MESNITYQELKIKSRIKIIGGCLLLIGGSTLYQIRDHASFTMFYSAFLTGMATSQLIKYIEQLKAIKKK